jgi:hypothetical protein
LPLSIGNAYNGMNQLLIKQMKKRECGQKKKNFESQEKEIQ